MNKENVIKMSRNFVNNVLSEVPFPNEVVEKIDFDEEYGFIPYERERVGCGFMKDPLIKRMKKTWVENGEFGLWFYAIYEKAIFLLYGGSGKGFIIFGASVKS